MNTEYEDVDVEVVPEPVSQMQVYEKDKASLMMQIETARRYPRNEFRAISSAIKVVTMDVETASTCTYSLKKGGKLITGPSVHLAKILAQRMGNMRIENRVVGYDDTHVTAEAICYDLETNFMVRTQIKKSITGSSGRYSEDMIVITGNAANAIALRNAVFAVIDASVIKKVYNAALGRITGDVSDENKLSARLMKVVDGFKKSYHNFNLTDEEIAGAVGKQSLSHLTAEDLAVLIGFEKSLQDGEMTVEGVFRPSVSKFNNLRPVTQDKSEERIIKLIEAAKTRKDLEKISKDIVSNEARIAYDNKFKELK